MACWLRLRERCFSVEADHLSFNVEAALTKPQPDAATTVKEASN